MYSRKFYTSRQSAQNKPRCIGKYFNNLLDNNDADTATARNQHFNAYHVRIFSVQIVFFGLNGQILLQTCVLYPREASVFFTLSAAFSSVNIPKTEGPLPLSIAPIEPSAESMISLALEASAW